MDDLISRKMAIDAIIDHVREKFAQRDTPLNYICGLYKAEDIIEILPSAQTEIIRCKDCRWGREVCGNIECFVDSNIPPEYHGYEWFCPNGERRIDGKLD